MKISAIMVSNVHTCSPYDDLASAGRIMFEKKVGCLPIVDSHKRLVGMLTDRDICIAAYRMGWPLYEITVIDVMAKEVVFTTPDASVGDVEELMRISGVHRLPVVDPEHRVVGIISLTDLTREARREVGRKIAEITAEDVMETLLSISEHSLPVH